MKYYKENLQLLLNDALRETYESSDTQLEKFEEILRTDLTDREEKVLALKYGLEDGKELSFVDVGKTFDVSGERIRQIVSKAFKKLRHPSRTKKIFEGEMVMRVVNVNELIELDTPIGDCDFSIRTYNCLRRGGVKTVGELYKMSSMDLMKIKNLGKKSLKEIQNFLAEHMNLAK